MRTATKKRRVVRPKRAKISYTATRWGLPKGQAKAVGEELARIHAKHGELTPQLVVKAATPAKSPLHRFFDWDNATAAHKYRLWQARDLISSVRIHFEPDKGPARETRAFVNIVNEENRQVYMPAVEAMSKDTYRKQLALKLRGELELMRRRYAEWESFSVVFNVALEKVDELVVELDEAA